MPTAEPSAALDPAWCRIPAVEARGIDVTFGALRALSDVSIAVHTGSVHGLIGPNGSGKSTLLHALAGKRIPDSGHIFANGVDITRDSPAKRSRLGLSIKFQLARVYPQLTVSDNLLVALQAHTPLRALLMSRTRSSLTSQIETRLDEVGLAGKGALAAKLLSHGQQQWLEIAMARALEPAVLLLDEPTAGMSPQERRVTGEIIRLASRDAGVLIVDHDLDFIKDLCTHMTVLAQGAVVATGTPNEIEADPVVQDVFLTRV
jgi:branched-chain amino acid transport system ATP-binding protein